MQSDQELSSICKRIGVPLIGIYTKDKLPKERRNGAYIINMQDDNAGSGSHWSSFIIEGRHAAYFDSFGIHAPANVQLYLYPYRPYLYNTKHIQSIQTGFCGEYCAFWLKYMYQFHNLSLRQRMINFDRLWTNNTSESLKKLKMYMKDVFKDKHFDNV
jgi:hypothetical protein